LDEDATMFVFLVIITVVALIAFDYYVVRPRRALRRQGVTIPLPGLEPLLETARHVPADVFLQPTFTWGRIRDDGDLLVGLHPMLFGLVGAPYELELVAEGSAVIKGAPLMRVGHGEQRLTVHAPADGVITAVNHQISGETDWSRTDAANGAWVYRMRPDHIGDDVPTWFFGDRAIAWTRDQYSKLRNRLVGEVGRSPIGVVMADGGEIPVGVLRELDDRIWRVVQDEFLES
jgi:glycine cleavage system H lipoate-binding protein